ncbi:MAG: methionine synthase [Actinomycetales bacterium]
MSGPDLPAGTATGVGSLPGTDADAYREAVRFVADRLPDLPHLPELPGRGPGADLVGRGAALLVDLPVELQPHGWRLVDHAGRDAARAGAYLRSDLDQLAEAFDGYAGPLKVQMAGPWTLAASLWLPRGERAITDPGARRDLVASLADGVRTHAAAVRAAVPGAELVIQLDEPSLTAALAGRLPTASGYGLVRALDPVEAERGLADVVAAVHGARAASVVHSCAPDVPVALLHRAGTGAVSLDLALVHRAGWEALAEAVEGGLRLWAGAVPAVPGAVTAERPDGLPTDTEVMAAIREPWHSVGLPITGLAGVVTTPACGLGSATPEQARAVLDRAVASGRALAELAHED